MKLSEKEKQKAIETLVSKYPELQEDKTFMTYMKASFDVGYTYKKIFKRFDTYRYLVLIVTRLILTVVFGVMISFFDTPTWGCAVFGIIMSYFCTSKFTKE